MPFPVEFNPYSASHLSEMMQILSFTGLVFYLMVKKLAPDAKLNLDIDYFYRKGTVLFIKFDEKVIAPVDAFWGELYRTLGLKSLFGTATLSYIFDQKAIDGVVDGTAHSVMGIGSIVKKLQTGRVQTYIGLSLLLFFAILWAVL
jgi:multicomponent Na+:H+ antiporter subunit D